MEAGDFPGDRISVSWGPGDDAEGSVTPDAASEPPVFEPVPGDLLTDDDGKLIQIAPDPVDPWCDDPVRTVLLSRLRLAAGFVTLDPGVRGPNGHSDIRLRCDRDTQRGRTLGVWQPSGIWSVVPSVRTCRLSFGISRRISAAAIDWTRAGPTTSHCVQGGSATLPAAHARDSGSRDTACCITRHRTRFNCWSASITWIATTSPGCPSSARCSSPIRISGWTPCSRGRESPVAWAASAGCIWQPKWTVEPGPSSAPIARTTWPPIETTACAWACSTARKKARKPRVTWKSVTSSPGTSNTVPEHLPMIR